MPLGQADKAKIATASATAIQDRAREVAGYLTNYHRWLGSNNRYWSNPVKALSVDFDGPGVNAKHVGEYVAASASLHSADAWSYLGSSLRAHLAGQPDVARHLAYYAELRAAISLLAARGIGIFNCHHFVIDASGNVAQLQDRGTHEAAWLYLEEWAQTADGASVVGSVIRPAGRELADWIAALPGGPAWAPIGSDWLVHLGLDLKRLAEDRSARNEASYRATALSGSKFLPASDASGFAVEFVSSLEPDAPGSFGPLDLHFLRISVEAAFRAANNRTHRQAYRRFRSHTATMVAEVLGSGPGAEHVLKFIQREKAPSDPAIVAEARKDAQPPDRRHHIQAICRAALLLRIATGAAAQLHRAVGLTTDSSSSWWGPLGEARGLWSVAPSPLDLMDLWLDVSDGLDDLSQWRTQHGAHTYFELTNDCARPILQISTLDGLAIVGIASSGTSDLKVASIPEPWRATSSGVC